MRDTGHSVESGGTRAQDGLQDILRLTVTRVDQEISGFWGIYSNSQEKTGSASRGLYHLEAVQ